MGILKPATNQTAFLKLGLQGFEGSGKTFLACQFAIGMTKLRKGKKVAFFDTEKGSDFWVKKFSDEGIQLDVARSRSFSDLVSTIREAEKEKYDFLIIDSVTHVWRELQEAWKKGTGKKIINMQGWMTLKSEWSQFTDLYVNSKLHIAMCGRAGYEYDFDEDDDGKKEIIKTGTKMKAEGETGFEPDLLIETYKVPIADTLNDKKAKKKARGFINRCVVIKDRSDSINGKIFDKPKFEDFKSVIGILNLGGQHVQQSKADSSHLFERGSDKSYVERERQKELALEEIKTCLTKVGLDGTSAEAKKGRIAALEKVFGQSEATFINGLDLEILRVGVKRLKVHLGLAQAEAPVHDKDVPPPVPAESP